MEANTILSIYKARNIILQSSEAVPQLSGLTAGLTALVWCVQHYELKHRDLNLTMKFHR